MSVLEIKGVYKSFENENILENVSLELGEGEIVALLGISGSGKTTLFNIAAGLSEPDSGVVLLENEDITHKPGRVSYMLQKDLLLPYKTVIDNVALPLVIKGMKKKDARIKAGEQFSRFGLSGTEKKYPFQLSGGMKQRAALLRTYLFSERVALLDEPFSALDMLTKAEVHDWYLDIMDKIKLSTIFVTHDVDEAIFLSDRIYILTGKPGKVTKEIVIENKKRGDRAFLLTEEFLSYKKEITDHLNKKA